MPHSPFPDGCEPLYFMTRDFRVESGHCLTEMKASLASLCNMLQEIAGLHANSLGLGIGDLQAAGFTWMLTRLSVRVHRYPAWDETIHVTTWPCGTRGKLVALRHFLVTDCSGNRIVEATSEWLYIDLGSLRPARLPASFVERVPADTWQLDIGQNEKFFEPQSPETLETISHTVRRHDIDANRHVNNVHYTEWALESLPEALFFRQAPASFDIYYKQSAHLGDTVVSETETAPDLPAGTYIHRITRASDNALLALARSTF